MVVISEVVDVSIRVESSSVATASFDSILLAGNGGTSNDGNFNAGWANHEVRKYTSYAALAADADIKPSANIVNMAQVAFAQIPTVGEVYVGRIDEGTPAAQVSTLKFDTAPLVSGQDVEVFIDGASIGSVSWATDNDTTMDAVAALIQGEAEVTTAVASIDGAGSDKNFITITGAVAGESFLVTAEVQTGSVVDEAISQVITTAATDKISAADINALYANNSSWFGYCHDFSSNADAETAAGALAALKKYGAFRHESAASIPSLGTNYSFSVYSSSADSVKKWVQVAWLSTMLGRQIGSYNPAFLGLELTDVSSLSASDEALLKAGNSNWYSTIAGRDLTYNGKAGNGGWIDTYINVLWLEARMEERVFAALVSADKIAFSDAGIQGIVSEVGAQLEAAKDLGVILSDPNYSIDYPLASEISATDKSNRLLTGITFTAYAGSGVNKIEINGTLVD